MALQLYKFQIENRYVVGLNIYICLCVFNKFSSYIIQNIFRNRNGKSFFFHSKVLNKYLHKYSQSGSTSFQAKKAQIRISCKHFLLDILPKTYLQSVQVRMQFIVLVSLILFVFRIKLHDSCLTF